MNDEIFVKQQKETNQRYKRFIKVIWDKGKPKRLKIKILSILSTFSTVILYIWIIGEKYFYSKNLIFTFASDVSFFIHKGIFRILLSLAVIILLIVLIIVIVAITYKTDQKIRLELLYLWCDQLLNKYLLPLIMDPYLVYQYEVKAKRDYNFDNILNYFGINVLKSKPKINHSFAEYFLETTKISKFIIPLFIKQSPELANNKYFKGMHIIDSITLVLTCVPCIALTMLILSLSIDHMLLTVISSSMIGFSITLLLAWVVLFAYKRSIVSSFSKQIVFYILSKVFFEAEGISEVNPDLAMKVLFIPTAEEEKIINHYLNPEQGSKVIFENQPEYSK